MKAAVALGLVLAFVVGLGVQAQENVVDGVVIEAAPRTREVARKYVDRVAAPPMFAVSLATWQTPICIGTENLKPEIARRIVNRVASRARALGVQTRTARCQQNVTIMATVDGHRTAELMVKAQPAAFRASSQDTQRDHYALRRFVESDAPVRWWTLSAEYDTYARTYTQPLWNRGGATQRQAAPLAMFNQNLVRAMIQTVVVLDVDKAGAAPTDAMADYIAMVVLSEADPEAKVAAFPTVLNLFRDGGAAEPGMTVWDDRYLQALYCARVRQPGMGQPIPSGYQLSEIARLMTMAEPPHRQPNGVCK